MNALEPRHCPFCKTDTLHRPFEGRAGFAECAVCGCCNWPPKIDAGLNQMVIDLAARDVLALDAVLGEQ